MSCIIFWSLLGIATTVAPGIAAIIIGVSERDTDCDDEAFISLSNWLITYGSVNLGITVIMILSLVAILSAAVSNSDFGVLASGSVAVLITVVTAFWNIAWNIVGAVALFKYSMDCLDSCVPIWAMTLAALIIQWISMFLSYRNSKHSSNNHV